MTIPSGRRSVADPTHEGPACADAAPATPRLRVLVIGEGSEQSSCDVYRSRMYVEPLRRLGVEVRYGRPSIPSDGPVDPAEFERRTEALVESLVSETKAADVVVFVRAYLTHHLCLECDLATLDTAEIASHTVATGHAVNLGPNAAVRRYFDRIETDVNVARRLAIVYETDDDLLQIDPANGLYRLYRAERPLIERMIRRADVVTTSTPVLAARLADRSGHVRIVRNAIDPAWYGELHSTTPAGDDSRPAVRLVYYGSIGRLPDYEVCSGAVDAIARTGARRVWIGAPGVGAMVAGATHLFDEIHPYVAGIPDFASHLARLRPAIGLAPLVDNPFSRGRSELHWLEYTMAGAVTVASRMSGRGPYDPIRHGVDGFLVGNRGDWLPTLRRLAQSTDLRAEIAGRARARVLADYTVDVRASDWCDAFGLAASAAGRGLARIRSVGIPDRIASINAQPDAPTTGRRASPSPTRRQGMAIRHAPSGTASQPSASGVAPKAAEPAAPSAAPSPDALLRAYLAAGTFAARSPLRLLVGADRSAVTAAVGRPASDGWVTIDTAGGPDVEHDARFGLPFADDAIECVELQRVIEPVGPLVPVLLGEAARVLRPGGAIRIVTEDQAVAVAARRALELQGVFVVGRAARLPDFSAERLEALLAGSGFAGISREPAAPGVLVLVATVA